ncbi:TPA: hypothetical protein IAA92_00400 [Candidatus Galligastranaerophilus intestinigallinarum]|nr:hypothetical protein [Candidatus Galligastranaerophilus intestinigallinarum]
MHISKVQNNTPFLGFSLFSKKPKKEDFQTFGEVHNKENNELNVKVPTDGYKSFFCPKAAGKGKGKKEVTIKKGRAIEWGIRPYTGLAIFRNKKDELIGLEYKNGEITASYKGNGLYKKYEYLPQNEALKESGFNFSHKFQDGSALEEEQFFGMDDVTYKKITTKPKGETTHIKQNSSPKYKGEPVLRVTNKNVSKAITADFNEEQFEFSSIDEAKAYFLNEYGIKAELINLKQAHLLKSAIDEYAKLDYQEKGKKLFDGLEIGICERKPDKNGELAVEYFTDDTEFDPNVDPNELDEEFFENYEAKILFNKNYDWENLEQNARESYLEGFHSEYSPYHAICHELAHYLHLQNSPKQFYLCSMIKPSKKEAALIKTVSEYAANNMDDFVAEYITGRLAGKNYLKQVDELYEKYKGPNLF